MADDLRPENVDLYMERYLDHIYKGDDRETARLRIIEDGCPIERSFQIEAAAWGDEGAEDE